MPNFGLRDIPVENIEDEALGLRAYVDSLTEFIQQCETPMTIALQGDWGSGKTSLMNLIKTKTVNSNNKIHTVWFNTWQFSQFEMQGELSISLLSNFVDALGIDESKTAKNMLFGLRKLGKLAASQVADMVGGEIGAKTVDKIFEKLGGSDIDPAQQISKLKEEIEKLVKKKIEKDSKDRIVVFIDDLDRLLPEKAVELLEVFKLFLDVPGCVYVLACDYHVIAQGLKKKFGVGADELKGKSFFDKIIQLPFSMPLGQYQVKDYIKSLLDKIHIEYNKEKEDDITSYADMVNYSTGFNPRSMKRLFNSLLLLNLVAEKRKLFESSNNATKAEKQRIIFGSLCLQTAYEPVYRYMQKNIDTVNKDFFDAFKDERNLESTEKLADLRKDIAEATGKTDLRKLSQFMDAFYECIQIDKEGDKNALSDVEIKELKKILQFSSLTSTDASATSTGMNWDERYANRDLAKAFIEELNEKYDKYLKQLNVYFKIYQPRSSSDVGIYIYMELEDNKKINLGLWLGDWRGTYMNGSTDFIGEWLKKHCSKEYPNPNLSDGEFLLSMEKMQKEIDRSELEKNFKEQSIRDLDILLPKIVESFADKIIIGQ